MMGLPRKVIFVLAALSGLPALALRADEAEQRFRELVEWGFNSCVAT